MGLHSFSSDVSKAWMNTSGFTGIPIMQGCFLQTKQLLEINPNFPIPEGEEEFNDL